MQVEKLQDGGIVKSSIYQVHSAVGADRPLASSEIIFMKQFYLLFKGQSAVIFHDYSMYTSDGILHYGMTQVLQYCIEYTLSINEPSLFEEPQLQAVRPKNVLLFWRRQHSYPEEVHVDFDLLLLSTLGIASLFLLVSISTHQEIWEGYPTLHA